jgi:hypothetical protein
MIKDSVKITPRMLKYLKVPQGSQTTEIISLLLEESLTLIDIKKWCNRVPVDGFYEIFSPYARESQSITKLLRGAEKVWLIAVSLGENLEFRSRGYFRNNEVFRGYILDRLGSFLIEEEVKKIDAKISQECQRDGITTTQRYSPGYGDFSIKAQQIFFNLAKDYIHGLRISSGSILFPEKTVTAIKGVVKSQP